MGTLLGELSTLALLEVEPLLAPTPSRVDSVIDRGKGILKSAGAFSFICCSLNSFQISGSMTCLTTASAASVALLEVAEELVWKPEGSSSFQISTLGSQMQTFRYLDFRFGASLAWVGVLGMDTHDFLFSRNFLLNLEP